MYVVVRNYTDEASDVVEQARQREESIKEVMRGIDGFVAYYLIDTQSGGLASVSVFEDRAGAEESTGPQASGSARTSRTGCRTRRPSSRARSRSTHLGRGSA